LPAAVDGRSSPIFFDAPSIADAGNAPLLDTGAAIQTLWVRSLLVARVFNPWMRTRIDRRYAFDIELGVASSAEEGRPA